MTLHSNKDRPTPIHGNVVSNWQGIEEVLLLSAVMTVGAKLTPLITQLPIDDLILLAAAV